MTRIDFYILSTDDDVSRLNYTARLCEKALRHNMRVLVLSDGSDQLALDDLLWDFKQEAFAAHSVIDQHNDRDPIVLSAGTDAPLHHDLLINLTPDIPPQFGRFKRLAEIVIQQPSILAATREHFRHFKERGYPLHTHKV